MKSAFSDWIMSAAFRPPVWRGRDEVIRVDVNPLKVRDT